jgi:hypothetical protein
MKVHLAPGASAAGCIKQALRPFADRILVNWDCLSCGPHPHVNSIEAWKTEREAYVKQLYADWPAFSFSTIELQDDLISNLSVLKQADTIVLWKSECLQEQMLAAWLVWAMEISGVDTGILNVVEFSKHQKSGTQIRGLGELHPDALQSGPSPRCLSEHEMEELRIVWRALTAPTPDSYSQVVSDSFDISAALKRSLHELTYRYPDIRSGLGIWDASLLRYTKEKGPKAARIVGYTMGFAEGLDSVGDGYLLSRIRDLAAAPHPLIKLSGDPTHLRQLYVELTEDGHRVLTGEIDNITLNGINDWVCGVHLDSRTGVVWVNDHGTVASI